MNEQIDDSKKQPWAIDFGFDANFFHSPFYKSELADIKKAFLEWLEEMSNNKRSFAPFELSVKKSDLFSLIKGVKPAKSLLGKGGYALFDSELNRIQSYIKKDAGKGHCFIELFYAATDVLMNLKFRM